MDSQDTKSSSAYEGREGRRGRGIGVWVGCFGWLIGLLAVAYDALDVLWPQLLGGALLTAGLAWALDHLASRRLRSSEWMSLVMAGIGILSLYYALVVEPALRRAPHIVERMRRLGSVVTVPWWVGAAVLAASGVWWWVGRQRD
ncbi:MAG: hypothetical protein AB7T63_06015 [Planctomycetota bacterium]